MAESRLNIPHDTQGDAVGTRSRVPLAGRRGGRNHTVATQSAGTSTSQRPTAISTRGRASASNGQHNSNISTRGGRGSALAGNTYHRTHPEDISEVTTDTAFSECVGFSHEPQQSLTSTFQAHRSI